MLELLTLDLGRSDIIRKTVSRRTVCFPYFERGSERDENIGKASMILSWKEIVRLCTTTEDCDIWT
jgi:hypothetical protein